MSFANDLYPPIDAGVETETIGFDFGPALKASVSILSISSVTCTVESGADATPTARLIGSPALITSAATGLANQAVSQQFGNGVGGVNYKLQCVVNTSDSQVLSLWTHIPCTQPI